MSAAHAHARCTALPGVRSASERACCKETESREKVAHALLSCPGVLAGLGCLASGLYGSQSFDLDVIEHNSTRAVFDSILLRPRMMVDISQRDLHTTVLGQDIRFPIMLNPAGNHAAAHPDGKLASWTPRWACAAAPLWPAWTGSAWWASPPYWRCFPMPPRFAN